MFCLSFPPRFFPITFHLISPKLFLPLPSDSTTFVIGFHDLFCRSLCLLSKHPSALSLGLLLCFRFFACSSFFIFYYNHSKSCNFIILKMHCFNDSYFLFKVSNAWAFNGFFFGEDARPWKGKLTVRNNKDPLSSHDRKKTKERI